MFRKPFRIKSNNQIKGSDRKIVKENLHHSFPNLSETDLENVLPKKEIICIIKLVTASNETVHVYVVQKYPIIFDVRGILLPTVYLLWKFPNILPSFTTHPKVFTFLMSGADLMLPGVITPPVHSGLFKYGNLQEGAVAYVNLSNNKAAVAVGVTAQSSSEMLASGGKGKCLTIYHFFGDNLCSLDGVPNLLTVSLGPPEWLNFTNEDFPELGVNKKTVTTSTPVAMKNMEETENIQVHNVEQTGLDIKENVHDFNEQEEMDELLNRCFFIAIKYSKTLTMPILTSNFYKLQMIPVCPEGKSLDFKKSSYKKMKTFLNTMSKDGIISVSEMKKGVECITKINYEHPRISEFYIEPDLRPKVKDGTNTSLSNISLSFIITPSVLPIFSDTGLNKGDTVQISEIRKHVTEYVKRHHCQDEENKTLVTPKEALLTICKTKNKMSWEEVMERVCESMKSCYMVNTGMQEIVNKGKLCPITLTVSQRSGNKKVTLVDNLELFGIKITDFAKECQHGVAASTSISSKPGKKCDQLLVQGNQVIFIFKLLTEKYKIPQKYIKGLEYAPKRR